MEILDWLENERSQMIELLGELVDHDSPSDNKQALDSFVELLGAKYDDIGADTEVLDREEYGNHLRASWGEGPEKVLILCHMDTVWPAGESERRPFTVKGERAYGPGVFDMKGGFVVAFYALRALRKLGLETEREVVVLCNSDEELGSPSSRELIEHEAASSSEVFVLEPSRACADELITARKGVGIFELKVTGRPSHAGAAPERGVSAVEELAHQILKLQSMTDLNAGVSVNVGVVQGGSRSNVVPAAAEAEIDLRVTSEAQAEQFTQRIKGLTPQLEGASLEVTGGINRPPMERTEANRRLYERAESIARELGIQLAEGSSGGASDGNFTSAQGIPTLDGLGAVGDGGHSTDEYVVISELPRRAALLAGLIAERAGEDGGSA